MRKRWRLTTTWVTLLAVVLAFGGLAQASPFSDVPSSAQYAGEVNLLVDLGITKGMTPTTFGPNDKMTREQFAAFVIRASHQEALANSFSNQQTSFQDDAAISSWARGSVYLAVQQGIIRGYPDNTFRPQGLVTEAEALTMLVRALGFEAWADSLSGKWPANYLMAANVLGLDAGLAPVVPNQHMLRWQMAIALTNALYATAGKKADGSPDPAQQATTAWAVTKWGLSPVKTLYIEGTVENVSQFQSTLKVSGKTLNYVNAGAGATLVTVNGAGAGTYDVNTHVAPGQYVKVGYQGNKAVSVDIHVWNAQNWKLNNVTVTPANVTIQVQQLVPAGAPTNVSLTPNTLITIDGQKATPQELDTAFQNAQGALVSLRIENKLAPGVNNLDTAAEVAVLIDNTVSGGIAQIGSDTQGNWAKIGNQVVYYQSSIPLLTGADLGKSVVWLLGTDGKAYLDVTPMAPAGLTEFFARYEGSTTTSAGTTYHFKLADGSVWDSDLTGWGAGVTINLTADINKVVWIDTGLNTINLATIRPTAGPAAATKLSNGLKVGSSTYALASYGVWVWDNTNNKYIPYSTWTPTGAVTVYLTPANEVGYIWQP